MVVAPQAGRDQSGRAIADWPTIDADHRQYGLAGRRNEGLAGGIGFLDREGAFLKGEALRPDRIDHNRTRDPGQDVLTDWMGYQLAIAAHDPGIRRSALRNMPLNVDKPSLARAPLAGGQVR
jgi:hypothetical protein